jgi:gas vesicle protein
MKRGDIGNFLIGVGMGATIAMLFAPSSGTKTRGQLRKAAADGATYVKRCGETTRESVLDVMERGKDQIGRYKEGVAASIKRGSQAFGRVVS